MHASLPLRATRSISLEPILFTQVPNLDTVRTKLSSFIDVSSSSQQEKEKAMATISTVVIPFLKSRFDEKTGVVKSNQVNQDLLTSVAGKWEGTTTALMSSLSTKDLFPLIDLWRVALLDNALAAWCVGWSATTASSPPQALLAHISTSLQGDTPPPKPVLLTSLRMASNAFASVELARTLLSTAASSSSSSPRDILTRLIVPSLLHEDAGVRTAAASLTFNVVAHYQRPRMKALRSGRHHDATIEETGDGDGEWEVEMVSATVEAIKLETASEDVGTSPNRLFFDDHCGLTFAL